MRTIKEFTQQERFNICPSCGKEIGIFQNEAGQYKIGCPDCDDMCISLEFNRILTNDEQVWSRISWNLRCLSCEYSDEALEALGISDGEYIVADYNDVFILPVGNETNMISFLQHNMNSESHKDYIVYMCQKHHMYEIGKSYIVELILKNITNK